MKRSHLASIVLIIFVLLCAWAAVSTQSQKPSRPIRVENVKGDLYLLAGEGGNVAAYTTNEGVILVDDMFDRNHDEIMRQVRTISDKPIKYVLNTHQHDDHAGGNDKMLPVAEIIAHRNVRANLIAKRQPYYEDTPGTPIGLPRVVFSSELSLFLGGKEVHAGYYGRGHTNGDAVIYFPEVKAIHTGDLFLVLPSPPAAPNAPPRPPGVPIFIDYSQGGSFMAWSATLDGVLALDFDTVIPGHGPVSTKAAVVKFRADLETMRTRVKGLIKSGASRADVVKTMETDYGWKATGCPPSPPTGGCLQYQQIDGLIAELKAAP
jgi:cyclase